MRQTILGLALSVILGFATVASAQPSFSVAPASTPVPAVTGCDYLFFASFDARADHFLWCLSTGGNISEFRVAGVDQVLSGMEGYAVCSASGVHGVDNGNYSPVPFQPPIVVSGCSAGALPCVISRETTDGVFRLTQKFTQNGNENEIDIDMTLLNLSKVVQNASQITRVVFPMTDGVFESDIADKTTRSAWARLSPDGDGLVLRTDTFATPATTDIVSCLSNSCAATCVPSSLPTDPGEWGLQDTYNLGDLNPHKSKTVRFQLRRQ
jgi:hypothetical protein